MFPVESTHLDEFVEKAALLFAGSGAVLRSKLA